MAYSRERGGRDGEGESPAQLPSEHRSAILAAAIAASGFGFVLLGEDARIRGANAPACELLGHSEAELTGRELTEFVHPDDRGWSTSQLELLLGGVTHHLRQELRLLTAGDRDVWIELGVRPVPGLAADSVYAVAMLQDASDRRAREGELRRLADTDPLTELFNRRRFSAELGRHLARGARYGIRGSLLLIDIDGLKSINDRAGHLAGDKAIITTATLLRTRLRSSDVVARIGGDEFAVLLPHDGPARAATVAEALLQGAAAASAPGGLGGITLSIGITPLVPDGVDIQTLFERADAALYEIKRSGGNGYALRDSPGPPGEDTPSFEAGGRASGEDTPSFEAAGRPPGEDTASFEAAGRASGEDTTSFEAGEPTEERLPAESGPPPSGSPVVPAPHIDLETLLATVSELGGASAELVAWELFTDEGAVQEAWAAAVRSGLIERAHYDAEDRAWLYDLTAAGRARLGAASSAGEGEEPQPRRRRPPDRD